MKLAFGKKLNRLRAGQGYAAIGRACGCSGEHVRRLEKGTNPSLRIAWALAKHFNVSVDWLADDSAGWPPPKTPEQSAEDMVREALTGAGLVGKLSEGERHLLAAWRRLGDRRRGELLGLATGWADTADEMPVTSAEAGRMIDEAGRDAEAEQRRTRGAG